MTAHPVTASQPWPKLSTRRIAWETLLLMLLMFVHGGELVPGINEAHYLTKAKSYWEPDWCDRDLFLSSGKAHRVFDLTFGALTTLVSLPKTAWIGRIIGWMLLAIGIVRVVWRVIPRPYASLWVGLLWMVGVEQGNLAGEWIVGGIEAKVPAYAFVLFALERWLSPRSEQAWPLLGIAAAFHVLVGGWTVIAFAFAMIIDQQRRLKWRRHLLPLFIGGAISLFGLVPAIELNSEASPELALQAATIYTFHRLSHHLLATDFYWQWYTRFAAAVVVATIFSWLAQMNSPLRAVMRITAAAGLIAIIGGVISVFAKQVPDLAASLLRFYWFRLADAWVPFCGSLAIVAWIMPTCDVQTNPQTLRVRLMIGSAILLAAGLVEVSHWNQRMNLLVPGACRQSLIGLRPGDRLTAQQKAFEDWINVCQWIAENTDEDAVILTPRHQQTFKWYASRAEVVCWKDVPQDAASLVEWSRRIEAVFPPRLGGGRITINYLALRRFRQEYGASVLIADRRVFGGSLPLVRLYPLGGEINGTYEVYAVPKD